MQIKTPSANDVVRYIAGLSLCSHNWQPDTHEEFEEFLGENPRPWLRKHYGTVEQFARNAEDYMRHVHQVTHLLTCCESCQTNQRVIAQFWYDYIEIYERGYSEEPENGWPDLIRVDMPEQWKDTPILRVQRRDTHWQIVLGEDESTPVRSWTQADPNSIIRDAEILSLFMQRILVVERKDGGIRRICKISSEVYIPDDETTVWVWGDSPDMAQWRVSNGARDPESAHFYPLEWEKAWQRGVDIAYRTGKNAFAWRGGKLDIEYAPKPDCAKEDKEAA